MDMITQKIMNINAKALFKFFPLKSGSNTENKQFLFDTRKKTLFPMVVKEVRDFDDCPLLFQLIQVIKDGNAEEIDDDHIVYKHLFIMDFDDVFMPLPDDASDAAKYRKEKMLENARLLIENGLKIQFEDEAIELIPFDKSGNMSRNSRLSFLNKIYFEKMNERLNIGIDFEKIPVILSKYYAYRGLYLSSSQRVEHKDFEISEKSIIVVKDMRMKDGYPINGYAFERNVKIQTAESGEQEGEWVFKEPKGIDVKTIKKHTYDGVGLITPQYGKLINDSLHMEGANSFQIRLPFVKGMLHEVDVKGFIDEFSTKCTEKEKYIYEDAFGIERDLSEAQIFLTESMLKCKEWLNTYLNDEKNKELAKQYSDKNGKIDPMRFYCAMVNKYSHSLYISGTNLPYGHTKYTHLSYQVLNTLALTKEEFEAIIEHHGSFIKDPISYVLGLDEPEQEDTEEIEQSKLTETVVEGDDSAESKPIKSESELPISTQKTSWKMALAHNKALATDPYIKEQLKNAQKSLLTKIALGKVLVEGQTRYLCRDLLPFLVALLREEEDIRAFHDVRRYVNYKTKEENMNKHSKYLYTRFFLPQGKSSVNGIQLKYEEYCAFFRNPHLSRNEQYIMRPYVLNEPGDTYANDGIKKEKEYKESVKLYEKYFGHLSGIVMVPRGSTLPLCLGGADFDGDLVSVILNQNVVNAVKRGVYKEQPSDSLNWYKRTISYIEIPGTSSKDEIIPLYDEAIKRYIVYEHIYNTFSNFIGRISNAAISIGQSEYGRVKGAGTEIDGELNAEVVDPKVASCAKCTLLTGLEIDAAKNGIHPNLDMILGKKVCGDENETESDSQIFFIKTSPYVKFIKSYRELKSEPDFRLDTLKFEKGKDELKGKDIIRFIAEKCDTEITWYIEDEGKGTFINLLPQYFRQYHEEWKIGKTSSEKVRFDKKYDLSQAERQNQRKLNKSCDEIYRIYKFYHNTLYKMLVRERNKGFYAVENIELSIMRMYDEKQVDEMLFEIIPSLRNKIEKALVDEDSISEIRKRVNELNWQFQPLGRRGQVLDQIIGNGFQASALSDKEKAVLFHFNQQGYKMLWRMLDLIEGPSVKSYEEVYQKAKDVIEKKKEGNKKSEKSSDENENAVVIIEDNNAMNEINATEVEEKSSGKKDENTVEEFAVLIQQLEIIAKNFYEDSVSNGAQEMYSACIRNMRNIIDIYAPSYAPSFEQKERLLYAFYKHTRSDMSYARFFWGAFSWEEIEPIFDGERGDVTC